MTSDLQAYRVLTIGGSRARLRRPALGAARRGPSTVVAQPHSTQRVLARRTASLCMVLLIVLLIVL
ncbi:hypothetical protein ABGB19_10620 [Mycobacterium sp. B14F4]|uniref:hypothetical protein n=1 Tax=Mycobacterium sp. B14F4 TaxID=3153565 RepID=UPI00325E1AC2